MTSFTRQKFSTPSGLTLVGDVGGPVGAPGIILLHGGGQTRYSWAKTMDRLVERGYYVINYDARGHGDSDWSPTGDYSVKSLASDLRAVRDTIVGPVAFVGASMGGMTSFYSVGTSNPPIADALIMVDIVLQAPAAGLARIKEFMSGHRDGFATLEEAVAAVVAYNPDRPQPKNPSGLRRNLRLHEDGRLYWHWDPRLIEMTPSPEPPTRMMELVEVAKNVTIPTLVVRGKNSDIVDDAGIAEMCNLVPQTEVYNVPGAGHMVAGDRNDIFSAGVFSFLDRHLPAHPVS